MADYYLDNQPGATFRAELNQILAAVRASNASSSAPAGAVSGQSWFETDTQKYWLRNAANNGWMQVYTTTHKPTKTDVGLNLVANYSNTSSLTDSSSNKFALAAATYTLHMNKLDKTATAVNSEKLNNRPASFYATATHSHAPAAVGAAPANHTHSEAELPNASISGQGVVQLSNSTGGSSQTKAATELAVKNAKSEAIAAGVPVGTIVMWAGTVAQIPPSWQLCNGQGTASNGIAVPDLRDRFVVGAGGAYSPGATGGSVSKTSNTAGAHGHSVSVGNTTLSASQIPAHNHSWYAYSSHGAAATSGPPGNCTDMIARGQHITTSVGGSGSHNHSSSCNSGGNHSHTVDVRPPYYALCYIIKMR